MCDIHALHILPSQVAINSIALYRKEFDKEFFDYTLLLKQLKNSISEHCFMGKYDNAEWMRERGADYLINPSLFSHAPLTYLCIFLAEIFKKYELVELVSKLTPQILKSALTRLNEFKLN